MRVPRSPTDVRRGFESLLEARVLTNAQEHYDEFYASDRRWILAAKNALEPRRMITKARYGQLVPLPARLNRATRAGAPPEGVDEAAVSRSLSMLRRDGFVKLDGYFAEIAARLVDRYELWQDRFQPSSSYSTMYVNPTADEDVLALTVDPFVLSVVARYYRAQPYQRNMPVLTVSYPEIGAEEAQYEQRFSAAWHWDTVNLFTAHVLLNDAGDDASHMVYAKGTHRRHHHRLGGRDRSYSDAYVRSRYEILDADGPPGTLYLFDNNGIHRFWPVKDSFRATFQLTFTPGNSIFSQAQVIEQEAQLSGDEARWRFHPSIHEPIDPPAASLSPLQLASLDGLVGRVPAGRDPST